MLPAFKETFDVVFATGLAIVICIALYEIVKLAAFTIGFVLGRKKVYADETAKLNAQRDFIITESLRTAKTPSSEKPSPKTPSAS